KVLATDSNGNLSWTSDTDTNTTYSAGQGTSIDGNNFITLTSTLTGTDILALNSLRSSGTLVVAGTSTLSGAVTINNEVTFGSGLIINGVTYRFPFGDGSATGKVLKTDGNGNLSWSDDDTGGGSLAAGQGLTVANSFVRLNAVFSGTTIEATVLLSGALVHAQNGLTSSGRLVVESDIKGGSGAAAIISKAEFQSGAYVYASGAALLALDAYEQTQSGANAHIKFGYQGTFDVSLYRTARQGGNGGLVVKTLQTSEDESAFEIITGFGASHNKVFKVTASGAVHADGAFNSSGADYAEWFLSSDELKNGELVCIDLSGDNTVRRCRDEADANLMGIVSSNPAFIGNKITGAGGIIPDGYELIGLIGQVPAKVLIAPYEEGVLNIRPGDALTSAAKPGYARRALPGEPTVGIALERFEGAEGAEAKINVLISRRNSSVTVDTVEQHVLEAIAAMEIEDEVELLVSDAVKSINFHDDIISVVRQQLQEFNLRDTVMDILKSAGIGTGTTVATQAQNDAEIVAMKLGTGSILWSIVDTLEAEMAQLRFVLETKSGAIAERSPNYQNLSVEENVIIGGDTRVAKDLYIDGTLYAEDIFVPGIINIDGSMNVGGRLSAGELEVNSGAVVHGPLTIDGMLMIDGKELDLSGLVSSGSMLNLSSLLVKNSMMVLGSITIEGMAEILGDVQIGGDLTVSGSLIINNNQAGYAVVVETGTSATVSFGSGTFATAPVVTASSDSFMAWRIRNVSGTGFTIETKEPADEDITFSWHAMLTEDPITHKGLPAGASVNDIAFFVDNSGVPLSTSDIWNACIRNQQPIGLDGKPFNCRRYYDEDMWSHPDHEMQFMWDPESEDLRLVIPRGYYVEVVGDLEEEAVEPEIQEEEVTEETEDVEVETGTGETVVEDTTPQVEEEVIEDVEVETGTGETVVEDTSPQVEEEVTEEVEEIEVIEEIEEEVTEADGTEGTEGAEGAEVESEDPSPQVEEEVTE
ncbi:MAG: hypothetical protein O3A80_05145, partial [bacterium]|nr:hypothetical protein [bacterium]